MSEGKRKSMKCDSFIFYASFFEAIKELPDENQLALYNAIFEYGLNGVEPNLTGINKTVFTLIAPQLKANRTRYENGCKGGAPAGNSNARKQPRNNRETTESEEEKQPRNNQKQPNNNENVNENISLLKIKEIKNKFRRAGAYTGVFDDVIDEVLTFLVEATELPRPLKFSGVTYTAEDFRRIVNTMTVEDLCLIVNTLLLHKDDIVDARYYVLGVIANIAGGKNNGTSNQYL